MIKLTLPNGESTVMESIGGKTLLENATSVEARKFMKSRNESTSRATLSPRSPKAKPKSQPNTEASKEGAN